MSDTPDNTPPHGTGAAAPRGRALLIEELERAPRGLRLRPGTWLWGLLALLLSATLAVELVRHQAGWIVHTWPAARPALEWACPWLRCTVPPRRDLTALGLTQREIRKHPQVADALLVSATLHNRAAFAQPLPELELTLYDLTGQPVASRRFAPAAYLREGDAGAPLAPDARAYVAIEIMDPGRRAHGFEFALH